jgi:hypothetical protein
MRVTYGIYVTMMNESVRITLSLYDTQPALFSIT